MQASHKVLVAIILGLGLFFSTEIMFIIFFTLDICYVLKLIQSTP